MDFQTMSTACTFSEPDLLKSLEQELPTNFDQEEDEILRDLEFLMDIESSMIAYESDDQFEEEEVEIRSLIQLPGSHNNSTVWVHTKTGRRAKIILEAQDESENVGLLEFEDCSQEIRRHDSYADPSQAPETPTTQKMCRLDTLTVPNMGGMRLPSMRAGKNPNFDPNHGMLVESQNAFLHQLPSNRAGKNPNFNPAETELFWKLFHLLEVVYASVGVCIILSLLMFFLKNDTQSSCPSHNSTEEDGGA